MTITIKGAREHNLQNVDVEIGSGLTVVTGISGSGKTSLVFDTLYHEARRRFLEIFSLGSSGLRLSPAQVDSVDGLGPAVAVGQNLLNRNPSSTLATASGLHPLLRILYARFGQAACPKCGAPVVLFSQDGIIEKLEMLASHDRLELFAPLVNLVTGSHAALLKLLLDPARAGEPQAPGSRVDPSDLFIDGLPWSNQRLDPAQPHQIDLRLAALEGGASAGQLRKIVETAAQWGAAALKVHTPAGLTIFSTAPVCPDCGTWFKPAQPSDFHSPCPSCRGAGCATCGGTGLEPQAAAVRWASLRLPDLLAKTVDQAAGLLADHPLPAAALRVYNEISARLEALQKVGLGYLSLDRPAPTLSRGEGQRLRLAITLTSRLEDMLHVLDEPTVGLHPADVLRLLPALRQLAGPVVYVEHDRLAAAMADQAIDLGPGAGSQGGRILFNGPPSLLWQADTPSGRAFSLRERPFAPVHRAAAKDFLSFRGASLRNLRDLDIPVPLGRLTVVTGVSGSGKSTLVEDVIFASLSSGQPKGCRVVEGPQLNATLVDQSPIGRNPRSNPATYTNLADIIRNSFAAATLLAPSFFSFNRPEGACPTCQGLGSIEVSMRYLPSTWIPCTACDGQRFSEEVLAARASFADRPLSIAEFFELPIDEVLPLLAGDDRLSLADRHAAHRILQALVDIGLGYLALGQPSPTLSGGEAQRVKLAKYLGKKTLGSTLLIMDEPSTGLHPADIGGLLVVLDRLVRSGATVLVVEHNTDIIRAADWIIDLGPGAGPKGGQLLYAGPASGLETVEISLTAQALKDEAAVSQNKAALVHGQPQLGSKKDDLSRQGRPVIAIRGARANNLKNVDVDFPKGSLTVVTGLSGSGKSSLLNDTLEAEARRRFLESLSMYERQSTREGVEAPVNSVSGLGVAVSIGPERRLYEKRATVGSATEIDHHLAVLMSAFGERDCPNCGTRMVRQQLARQQLAVPAQKNRLKSRPFQAAQAYSAQDWTCPACQLSLPVPRPRHFSPGVYAAACRTCHGLGTLQIPDPDKLIIHPEKPLIAGAMYSPGFFPAGYLGKPFNGGYDMVQGLAEKYQFDPATLPWNQMSPEAQQAFLFGIPDPIPVRFVSRTGRTHTGMHHFPGFYGWVRDWDVGGTYTCTLECGECHGSGLRPEYAAVTLAGYTIHQIKRLPLDRLEPFFSGLKDQVIQDHPASANLKTILRRLHFLVKVGLGYLTLNRVSATLSAGEAQRIKLAGLLGSGLTSLTVLMDEPTRGIHPSEVQALLDALVDLRDEGNTVIAVEHDLLFMRAADFLVDMGPGAGAAGGKVVAVGTPEQVSHSGGFTGAWLRGERRLDLERIRRQPAAWMQIRGAKGNNLSGEEVRLPLGVLVGVCGISGSGKSTLMIDTLGRALAPRKITTSVAREPIDPEPYDLIEGAPARTVIVDQTREGLDSPLAFLGIDPIIRRLYAASEDAQALGLDEKDLTHACSECGGRGAVHTRMEFLPGIDTPCETCQGTGLRPEAWDVAVHGVSLPDLYRKTLDEVYELFKDEPVLEQILRLARQVGLGYLVLRQPAYTLSGGEAQRLKITRELRSALPESSSPAANRKRSRPASSPGQTLYILDEPSVGQHLEDIRRLIDVLHTLVDAGGSVIIIEHHPHLLAACDWLIELGPGAGPDGGKVVASGTPESLASSSTRTAPYLRELLEQNR